MLFPQIKSFKPVATALLGLCLALGAAAQTGKPGLKPAAKAPATSSAGTADYPPDNVDNGVAAFQRGHYAIALRAWRGDADKGNPWAQNNIGYLYEQGLGVGQSYPEAMSWYKKAAAQNLPQAQFNIGTLYFYGYGVERNPREAVGWFRLAAKQNLPEAQYMVGLAYYEGQGVQPEGIMALEWFMKAALQGHVGGQMMAAMVYQGGDAGKADSFKAYVWSDIANINGSLDAPLVRDYASYKLSRREIESAKTAVQTCLKSRYKNCPAR
jgi:TPR repeat protein